ncbi:MAG: tyrosine-protein phosphatase [Solirubrobacterales bacterium]
MLRPEGLHVLTDGDIATLDALGIRLVCDLRSGHERRHRVSRWPGDGRSPVLPIEIRRARPRPGGRAGARHDPSGDTARSYMLGCYRDMPFAAFAGGLRAIVERILDRRALPSLLHCTAGKDRTVRLLGPPARPRRSMDTVLDEYSRSERHYGPERVSCPCLPSSASTSTPRRSPARSSRSPCARA